VPPGFRLPGTHFQGHVAQVGLQPAGEQQYLPGIGAVPGEVVAHLLQRGQRAHAIGDTADLGGEFLGQERRPFRKVVPRGSDHVGPGDVEENDHPEEEGGDGQQGEGSDNAHAQPLADRRNAEGFCGAHVPRRERIVRTSSSAWKGLLT
jgi:hypothetical protein